MKALRTFYEACAAFWALIMAAFGSVFDQDECQRNGCDYAPRAFVSWSHRYGCQQYIYTCQRCELPTVVLQPEHIRFLRTQRVRWDNYRAKESVPTPAPSFPAPSPATPPATPPAAPPGSGLSLGA